MFITVHAAASVIIGKGTSSSILAFVLAFISHLLLDIIPHGDEQMEKKFFGITMRDVRRDKKMALYGSLDACFLVIYLIFLFRAFDFINKDNIAWAIVGGVIPDFLVIIYKINHLRGLKWFYHLHSRFHRLLVEKIKINLPLKWGVFTQVCLLIIFTWILAII